MAEGGRPSLEPSSKVGVLYDDNNSYCIILSCSRYITEIIHRPRLRPGVIALDKCFCLEGEVVTNKLSD